MKHIKLFFAFVVLLIPFTFSCTEAHQKNSAVITITGPNEDSYIQHLDTLQIRGSIVSEMDLHGYQISIRRTDSDTEVFYYEDHYHGSNKNLNVDWICTVGESVELKLTVLAQLDHDGNMASSSVLFDCVP
jgi:hypothetical protein